MPGFVRRHFPGVMITALVTTVVWSIQGLLPRVLAPSLAALVAGLAIGAGLGVPAAWRPGLTFTARSLLKLAIVLMGARLTLSDVVATGGKGLLLIVVVVGGALLAGRLLTARLALPRRLGLLISLGAAICGNSAIVAAAPVVGAREEEVAVAVATTTLFGTAAVFLYPLLGSVLGMEQELFGTWAGLAINDTSQVLAAALAYGDTAGSVATVVKLTRNFFILPVLLGLAATSLHREKAVRWTSVFPWFVFGFVAVVAAASGGCIPAAAGGVVHGLSRFLVLMALAAIGMTTDVTTLAAIGLRPLLGGLALATAMGAMSLVLLTVF
ncbi:MAG: putative sulfate exporter family transporter [bacterium]|nr:putative sulfate exporter family transporter [bacterium]